MTNPQSDPASDVGAALARLAEQGVGIHRRMDNLEKFLLARVTDEERLTASTFMNLRTRIDSEAEKVALALSARVEATEKSEAAIEKRFDSVEVRFGIVNEFRGQLADQARLFMPRTEAVQLAEQATQRIRDLADQVPMYATRLEVQAMTDRINETIGELKEWRNRTEGVGQGAKDNRAGMYAAISIAVALIIAAIALFNFLSAR